MRASGGSDFGGCNSGRAGSCVVILCGMEMGHRETGEDIARRNRTARRIGKTDGGLVYAWSAGRT